MKVILSIVIGCFVLFSIIALQWVHLKNNANHLKENLIQNETYLASLKWELSEVYRLNNYKIEDFDLIDTCGYKQSILDIIGNSNKMVYKFSSSDCITCVESQLDKIKKRNNDNTIILVEINNQRWLRHFLAKNGIQTPTYSINRSIVSEDETHFFFVIDRNLLLMDVFRPLEDLPSLTDSYCEIVNNKYFNN